VVEHHDDTDWLNVGGEDSYWLRLSFVADFKRIARQVRDQSSILLRHGSVDGDRPGTTAKRRLLLGQRNGRTEEQD